MRKSLLCSVLGLFLAFSSAHAENRYGVLAGLNFAKLSGEGESSDTSTKFMGGVFAQFEVGQAFYFEPQLRFNRKGGSRSVDVAGLSVDADVGVSYLEIPLYAKYKIGNYSGIVPVVFAGPAVGFKLGSSASVAGINVPTGDDDGLKTIDFTVDAGVGAEYAVNENVAVSLSVAYSLGLAKISDADTKTRGLQTYAGVSFAY